MGSARRSWTKLKLMRFGNSARRLMQLERAVSRIAGCLLASTYCFYRRPLNTAVLVAVLTLQTEAIRAQESGVRTRLESAAGATLGGPASAPAQQVEDRLRRQEVSRLPQLDRILDPIEAWKEQIREDSGLSLSADYQALFQKSDTSVTDVDDGLAGQARILGNWALYDRDGTDPGNLVFILEHRHQLGLDRTPSNLAENIGYVGLTGLTFSDAGPSLTVAYWSQKIQNGRGSIAAGRIDPADYLDILGYVNPRTTFQNLAVTYNPVLAIPDPGFGIGGGAFLTDQFYALGVVSDANGSLTDVEWFPGGAELFKYAEVGWTPARNQRFLTNLHFGFFHVDERTDAGVPDSSGIVLSANHTFEESLMIFARAGWSEGEAPIARTAGTAGLMWRPGFFDDLIGAAITVADPVDPALAVQTTFEAFYRLDKSDNLALTASAQYLNNPGFNDDDPLLFGLRFRFNL